MEILKLTKNICDLKSIPTTTFQGLLAFAYHLNKETATKSGAIYIIIISNSLMQLKHTVLTEYGILMANITKYENNIAEIITSCHDSTIRISNFNILTGELIETSKYVHKSVCLYHIIECPYVHSTFSDGSIATINRNTNNISIKEKAHSYEVWSACKLGNILLTGSDDCSMKMWDSDFNLIGSFNKFLSGVTYIQKLNENTVINSTFDGSLYIFDIRSISKPVESSKISEQVWNWVSNSKITIYSCIYSGYAIALNNMDAITSLKQIRIHDEYHQHSTICYSSVILSNDIVTSGFYDCDLHIVKQWSKHI